MPQPSIIDLTRTDHTRQAPPDPLTHPYWYRGITMKRVLAYLIDATILLVLGSLAFLVLSFVVILSFGLLLPLKVVVLAALPFAYHIFLVAGPSSATLGMRVMGIEVRSLVGMQGRPSLLQATVQVLIFYATVGPTGFLVLLVALFNPHRRTLHDYLSGTIILNRVPVLPQ